MELQILLVKYAFNKSLNVSGPKSGKKAAERFFSNYHENEIFVKSLSCCLILH